MGQARGPAPTAKKCIFVGAAASRIQGGPPHKGHPQGIPTRGLCRRHWAAKASCKPRKPQRHEQKRCHQETHACPSRTHRRPPPARAPVADNLYSRESCCQQHHKPHERMHGRSGRKIASQHKARGTREPTCWARQTRRQTQRARPADKKNESGQRDERQRQAQSMFTSLLRESMRRLGAAVPAHVPQRFKFNAGADGRDCR